MEKEELKPVTLLISWVDLLGAKRDYMDDQVRRDRWEEWKRLCGDHLMTDVWACVSECCKTCPSCDGDWCNESQLPCNVNPVLTFAGLGPGLACQGLGCPN